MVQAINYLRALRSHHNCKIHIYKYIKIYIFGTAVLYSLYFDTRIIRYSAFGEKKIHQINRLVKL